MPPINVGILGAANIAWQTWGSIHSTGSRVTYLGCRDVEKGKQFVKDVCEHLGIDEEHYPKVGSYEDVVTSPDVDVVYVPIPVTKRDYWVQKCVANNKHVVGEKPAAVDADMLRQWIEALDARQLLYMDGTWYSHGHRVKEVCALVSKMGPIKHIFSNFSFNGSQDWFDHDIRLDPALEPQGSLGDLGWYNIRYILHLMNLEMPTAVTGRIIRQNDKGAVIEFSGDLTFNVNGVTTVASLYSAFDTSHEHTIHIATTEGVVQLKDFCHPITGGPASWYDVRKTNTSQGCKSIIDVTTQTYSYEEFTSTQRDNMWSDIASLMYRDEADGGRLKAKPEDARYWATLSWKTQAVMDKMLESARQTPAAAV